MIKFTARAVMNKKTTMDERILKALIDSNRDFTDGAPKTVNFVSPHYEIIIPIGDDYTASVMIDKESFDELKIRVKA